MTIRLDTPHDDDQVAVVAAIRARSDLCLALGLDGPLTISQPIQRRRYTVQREGKAFRFDSQRRADYFVIGGGSAAIASVRHDGKRPHFTELLGGSLPKRLLAAMAMLERRFGSPRKAFTLRIFENHRARLVSVVLVPASGQGYYVDVLDSAVIDEEKLDIAGDLATLRTRALHRLTMPSG